MRFYNTMTKQKEEFKPIVEGKVSMYACGPTVYDFFHIGNARSFVTFDMMRKYLEYKGYEVTYVQNFTDIDDKMINRANENGITVRELADQYIKEYFEDAESLGIKKATVHPRATDYIEEMIAFIRGLEEKGYTYVIDNDVYYDTEKFAPYGKLSGQNLEDLNVGSRIKADDRKKNPRDFVLWKGKKEGEPYWESPWGDGRPGWHLECSVMSTKLLGNTIDIHAGGIDLIFPHHENEIAQSEALCSCEFANYWLHVNFLNINNEKMSKSLGNFFTVREIREHYTGEEIRFFLLSAHYRNPVNFSDEMMAQAKSALNRLYNSLDNMKHLCDTAEEKPLSTEEEALLKRIEGYQKRFEEVMDDDFNTADAISVLFEIAKEANVNFTETSSKEVIEKTLKTYLLLANTLGFLTQKEEVLDEEIEALLRERAEARKNKNYKRSDEIRDYLKEKGILIEDTKTETRWKRIRT